MSVETIDLVLAVFADPDRIAECRERPLPEGIGQVIRLAAGEAAAVAAAVESTHAPRGALLDASVFFLQQILFAPTADSYRVLGSSPDAPQERLRENYRWLMKWLHPDRNQDGWEAVYADRVNVAWQDLKTPDRRREYDRRLPLATPVTHVPVLPWRHGARADEGPLLSGATVRKLPAIVLGSLGAAALALVAALFWAQGETARQLAERRNERAWTDTTAAPAPGEPPAPAHDHGRPEHPAPQPIRIVAEAPAAPLAPPPLPTAVDTRDPPSAHSAVTPSAQPPMASSTPAAHAHGELRPESNLRGSAIDRRRQASAEIAKAPSPVRSDAIAGAQTLDNTVAIRPAQREAQPPAAAAMDNAESDPPGGTAAKPQRADAEALVREFAAAYAAGDLARFDRLFVGVGNAANSRDPMRRRFTTTEMRYLEIHQLNVRMGTENALASARFRDTYVPRGERRAVTESGVIEWVILVDAGDARIAKFDRAMGRR